MLALVGCDNPDAFDCVKKSGTVTEEEIVLDEFEKVHIYDGLQLNLVYGEARKVTIRGGENLIPNVAFEVGGRAVDHHRRQPLSLGTRL